MKRIHSQLLPRCVLVLLLAGSQSLRAGFQYNPRDLVFGFRDGGASELVVNAGPASTFYNLAPGNTISIGNITSAQLTAAFPNLNNLSWSAAAAVRTNGDAAYPIQTLWVINPRSDNNTQTTPWDRKSQFAQASPGSKIDGLANAAVSYGASQSTGPNNTSYGVLIPSDDPGNNEYSYFIGPSGNYNNAFWGIVELTTPPDFSSAGQPVRADLYQLKPTTSGTAPGVYLGYFQFNPNGTMTYTAGASSVTVPRPQITSATRIGTTSSISFTTVTGGTYTLRYTNSAGLSSPVSTWASGGSVSGDGTTKILNDTSTATERFYSISAH